jgi:hypothetical protein
MKSVGVVDNLNKLISDNHNHDDVRRQAKAVLDALNRTDFSFESIPLKNIPLKDLNIRNAKTIFGDENKKIENIDELPQWVHNLLLAGSLFQKHSNSAAPRPRHVYVTSDLKFLVWKDPKKSLHPDNKMKIFKIRTIEIGRTTPQLQRKRFGKFLANESTSFSIIGRERTVDLEASSEAERNKWVEAIQLLLAYRKALKKANTQFDK